jgi:hypothetical protein
MNKEIKYKVVNGTSYHEETPMEVVNTIEDARINNKRIRMFLGDTETGRDWMEEYEVSGTVGRSMGTVKIPLLIKTSRSMGGVGILDHCIVKLIVNGIVKYAHPKYHLPQMEARNSEMEGYAVELLINGKVHARFKSQKQAERWTKFINGINLTK